MGFVFAKPGFTLGASRITQIKDDVQYSRVWSTSRQLSVDSDAPSVTHPVRTWPFQMIATSTLSLTHCVVISQTRWLVSQERLSPRAGTSVFIDSVLPPLGMVLTFEAGVSHHTPPPPGGTGLYRQF